MSPAGLEPTTYGLKVPENDERTGIFEQAQYNLELAGLVQSWPKFSLAKRAAIQALIEAQI
jgi:hypothetical protein